ncbi:MAG: hypothetical protein DHS80DRAFT_24728 [Piptocephalis tieghemiana]|nr:MAG: hypothetical protein DHS80DRAFT_24728 [Piptocephalis tieghemiana]
MTLLFLFILTGIYFALLTLQVLRRLAVWLGLMNQGPGDTLNGLQRRLLGADVEDEEVKNTLKAPFDPDVHHPPSYAPTTRPLDLGPGPALSDKIPLTLSTPSSSSAGLISRRPIDEMNQSLRSMKDVDKSLASAKLYESVIQDKDNAFASFTRDAWDRRLDQLKLRPARIYHKARESSPERAKVGTSLGDEGDERGALRVIPLDEVLIRENVPPARLEDWAGKTRKWMAEHIIHPLLQRIDQVDQSFEQVGLGHLGCKYAEGSSPLSSTPNPYAPSTTAGLFGSTSSFRPTTTTTFGTTTTLPQTQPPGLPQTLAHLISMAPNEPLVRERFNLERFLRIFDGEGQLLDRPWVLSQLRRLGEGMAMKNYTWESPHLGQSHPFFSSLRGGMAGRKEEARDKSPSDPSKSSSVDRANDGAKGKVSREGQGRTCQDGTLVVQLFCRYMDECMPSQDRSNPLDYPFTQAFFTRRGQPGSYGEDEGRWRLVGPRSPIQIQQVRSPEGRISFSLIHRGSDGSGEVWDMTVMRDGAFQVIALFIYVIVKEHAGYVGLLDVSWKGIDLAKIVQDMGRL